MFNKSPNVFLMESGRKHYDHIEQFINLSYFTNYV